MSCKEDWNFDQERWDFMLVPIFLVPYQSLLLLHKLTVKSPLLVGKFAPKSCSINWNLLHELKRFATLSKMQNICKIFVLLYKLTIKSPPFVGKFAPKSCFINWNLVHELKWFVRLSQKCKMYAKFSYPWTKFNLHRILAFQTKV